MEIKVTLEETNYSITVEPGCYTITRLGVAKEGKSIGKETRTNLGYPNSIPRMIQMLIQAHDAESKEIVTLQGYIERMEQAYKSVTEQVKKQI